MPRNEINPLMLILLKKFLFYERLLGKNFVVFFLTLQNHIEMKASKWNRVSKHQSN